MIAATSDLDKFVEMGGEVDDIDIRDEREPKYAVDFQYLMMNRWAHDKAFLSFRLQAVHDLASKVDFAAFLAGRFPVIHYDIREPDFEVPGLSYVRADITNLPLKDGEAHNVTCLHVAEHIGLGRYGDEIDPLGFTKACMEMERVLAPGGHLLFAVPVGVPRVVFNSHRVLSFDQVLRAFRNLEAVEFSAITNGGRMIANAKPDALENDLYGCGLFHFRRPK